jgi:hypothetical protein
MRTKTLGVADRRLTSALSFSLRYEPVLSRQVHRADDDVVSDVRSTIGEFDFRRYRRGRDACINEPSQNDVVDSFPIPTWWPATRASAHREVGFRHVP